MLRKLYTCIQLVIITGYLYTTVSGLKCFQCENHVNPACGVYFKAYQFKADHCPGTDYKCALQRQPVKDGWVGIVRVCYKMGSFPGMNETNGCRHWTNDDVEGYTALYCFCDTDYCNRAGNCSKSMIWMLLLCVMVSIISSYYC